MVKLLSAIIGSPALYQPDLYFCDWRPGTILCLFRQVWKGLQGNWCLSRPRDLAESAGIHRFEGPPVSLRHWHSGDSIHFCIETRAADDQGGHARLRFPNPPLMWR